MFVAEETWNDAVVGEKIALKPMENVIQGGRL